MISISIHALLAESDQRSIRRCLPWPIFLSTLSLRRATFKLKIMYRAFRFLSTLSLRRATWPGLLARPFFIISIHALLAESDTWARGSRVTYVISIHALLAESDINSSVNTADQEARFLSTLSLRRATAAGVFLVILII